MVKCLDSRERLTILTFQDPGFLCIAGFECLCFWPKALMYLRHLRHNHCKLSSIDLSESYKTVDHIFTGTSEQKSVTTAIWFDSPANINFLPKQIINNFPKFNGLIIQNLGLATMAWNLHQEYSIGLFWIIGILRNFIELLEYFGILWNIIGLLDYFSMYQAPPLKGLF